MSRVPGPQRSGSLSAAVVAAAPLWAFGRCLNLPMMRPLLAYNLKDVIQEHYEPVCGMRLPCIPGLEALQSDVRPETLPLGLQGPRLPRGVAGCQDSVQTPQCQ